MPAQYDTDTRLCDADGSPRNKFQGAGGFSIPLGGCSASRGCLPFQEGSAQPLGSGCR